MQRGPRPQPTALRILQGGSDPRREQSSEPIVPAGDIPACPDWLHKYAKMEWEALAETLYAMNVLTQIDQTLLAAYCMAYARWRQAEEDLAEMARTDELTHGALLKTKEGNAVQNPLIGVANVARRDMLRLAVEFGLTPSSRTTIEAGKREADPTAKRYFGAG